MKWIANGLIALLLVGCSVSEDPPPVVIVPSPTARPAPIPTAPPTIIVEDVILTAALGTSMYDNFGTPGRKAPWYDAITTLLVFNNVARAFTTYATSTEADRAPFTICQNVSTFMLSSQNPRRDQARTEVLGRDGKVLVQRNSAAAPCAAP